MKKLVYISHPSSGLVENTKKVEKIIEKLYSDVNIRNNCIIVSPIHNYGFMYNSVDYDTGLSFCTDLLERCDVMWVFGNWESSKGCKTEIALAKKIGIPYIIFKSVDEVIKSFKCYDNRLSILTTPIKHKDGCEHMYMAIDNITLCYKDKMRRKIANNILYGSIESVNNNEKNFDQFSKIIEIEMDSTKILDLSDARCVNQLSMYGFAMHPEIVSSDDEDKLLDLFMAENSSFGAVKRAVPGHTGLIDDNSVIKIDNKTVYRIYDLECIKSITVYDRYCLGSNRWLNTKYPFYESKDTDKKQNKVEDAKTEKAEKESIPTYRMQFLKKE